MIMRLSTSGLFRCYPQSPFCVTELQYVFHSIVIPDQSYEAKCYRAEVHAVVCLKLSSNILVFTSARIRIPKFENHVKNQLLRKPLKILLESCIIKFNVSKMVMNGLLSIGG
jgi:hypothetical protein